MLLYLCRSPSPRNLIIQFGLWFFRHCIHMIFKTDWHKPEDISASHIYYVLCCIMELSAFSGILYSFRLHFPQWTRSLGGAVLCSHTHCIFRLHFPHVLLVILSLYQGSKLYCARILTTSARTNGWCMHFHARSALGQQGCVRDCICLSNVEVWRRLARCVRLESHLAL